MNTSERIIVSLTTWSARIKNIPTVLDSIFSQTLKPDCVIINLAYDEIVPEEVSLYIKKQGIEIYRVPDTKVYKKFIPTLKRFPNDCIINIDDDMIYPKQMIEDFICQHKKYPDNPICGNHSFCFGIMCHCGEASLTKLSYFGNYLDLIDSELISNCPSSDFVYSYFAIKSGHPYIPATGYYGTDYTPAFNANESWTNNIIKGNGIKRTYEYLINRFGPLPDLFLSYFDERSAFVANEICKGYSSEVRRDERFKAEKQVRQSRTYRLGKVLLKPFSVFKKSSKS